MLLLRVNHRSIPAHAGEPPARRLTTPAAPVYPRPRGGTGGSCVWRTTASGLSPPTRGNRGREFCRRIGRGSIPAHAGEPESPAQVSRKGRVYPRPRGGTVVERRRVETNMGLSPPTRGNHDVVLGRFLRRRSIPAHAGEPFHCARLRLRPTVYPRPRGGTLRPIRRFRCWRGLSPPTRGNHFHCARFALGRGSIPAHAGEPRFPSAAWWPAGVYPRPRGGTD